MNEVVPTFGTLGPEGTDHERVTKLFIGFQGLSADVELMLDPIADGPEWILDGSNRFLVLCDAHPKIHIVTERYPQEVVPVASFLEATRDLSLIYRRDASEPPTIGLVEATRGYITDLAEREEKGETIVDAQSKPVLSRMLLARECDAGITYTDLANQHPDILRIEERYGKVRTTWTVFGRAEHSTYRGELIGIKAPEIFTGPKEVTARDD